MGIDQLKLHSAQLGYLKNLQWQTQTTAAQKQGKETRSNLSTKSTHETAIHKTCNIHIMICRRLSRKSIIKANNSAGKSQVSLYTTHSQSAGPSTITAQWSSGATTQPATTPMIALDLSDATTQPTDHNASSTQVINRISGSRLANTSTDLTNSGHQQPAQIAVEPHPVSLDEELNAAAKQVEDEMKAKADGMLSLDHLTAVRDCR
ncbi:hypothetical protein F511_38866 [Dorcoceras hygrometricum]|uniref:Uncharacterized protein n=1 Tax=Dorcoceras hygrometricum TaxID=472368 RepID=A0A2Z7CGG1_9LAMI|nr:hypothetical protein F511_38866 [Dorcoceras hygrometricum]